MANKIPQFPHFKRLGLEDQAEIDQFTRKFSPYSDFNFASLWCYDARGDHAFAFLHGNLVVRLRDYLSGEVIFSFLGNKDIPVTVRALSDYAASLGLHSAIRLVPEDVVASCSDLLRKDFNLIEEEDGFDYIHDAANLAALDLPEFAGKRKAIARLRRDRPGIEVRSLDLSCETIQQLVMQLCETWRERKQRDRRDFATERIAIELAVNHSASFQFVSVGAFIDGEMAGFTINEPIHDGFYMAHFGKCDPAIRGMSELLESETARLMLTHGCRWMNFQQDLGLPGLRQYKRAWMPNRFLRKFSISLPCHNGTARHVLS